MTQLNILEVRKDDLSVSRVRTEEMAPVKDGEILVAVDRFALTANNITYGVVGEKIGYWNFFPVEDGWGVIPVWGFADVVETNHPDIQAGERLYGYFPMGDHLVMAPSKVSASRIVDGAAHRAALPPVYNSYSRMSGEEGYDRSMDDERMLLFPLYATSYCLYDFLKDNDWFGAEQAVILSASSKTAIGLAIALHDDPSAPRAIGLTSGRNLRMVSKLGLYDEAFDYGDLRRVRNEIASVVIDMSGNGLLLADLHEHLDANMKYCANVGVTHYTENDMRPGFIRERSAMFFAPGHIQKRTQDWGPGVFEKKALDFWRDAAVKSRSWLTLDRVAGMAAAEKAFHQVRNGETAPDKGVIVVTR